MYIDNSFNPVYRTNKGWALNKFTSNNDENKVKGGYLTK